MALFQADTLIHDPEIDAVYIASPPGIHARRDFLLALSLSLLSVTLCYRCFEGGSCLEVTLSCALLSCLRMDRR